jgi:hypothetical protein
MHLQKLTLAALAAVVMLGSGAAAGQAPKPATPAAPTAQPGAKPRLVAPVRGVAQLGYTRPVVKNGKIGGKDFVISTIQVKNLASGSIAGLKVDEFWYDRAGNPVTGDNYRHPRPLQPGEVITITLETPRNPAMNRNQYNFSHANGEIKATLQPKL